MLVVWDKGKSRRNRAKHKVSFEIARLVFDDPAAISRPVRVIRGEQRWYTLGLVRGIVVILVAHTYREVGGEEVIRIISARKLEPEERRRYEKADDPY